MNNNFCRNALAIIGFAVLCAVGIRYSIASQANLDSQSIRVESVLVTVPVIVSDAQGRFVRGLAGDSFKLFEDGAQVPISLFLTSEDPIKIALLIDSSKSATTVLRNIKKAAERFLLQMRPQDIAMVASFDSDIQVLCPFSSDRQELKEGIRKARSGGSRTRMRDAISEIAQRRFRSMTGRKAIVLLTDGQDQGSQISAQELLNTIASSNTLVYSIFYSVNLEELVQELYGVKPRNRVSTATWIESEKEAAQYLEKISDLSAGRFYTSSIKDLDSAFKQISEELRAQYLLGFYPEKAKLDGATHALVVSVSTPDVTIRSRRSHRAAP